MRQYIVTVLAVLLVACGEIPTDPPASTADQLRVINGPATCNACDHVEFTVAGPGLSTVTDASLKNHATGADIETSAEIRHFVGDSGPVLQIKLGFVGSAPVGDYDLRLHAVGTGGAQASLNIPAAVKILTPPNDPGSPQPPGPTGTVHVTTTTSGPVPTVPYLVTVNPCDPVYVCPGRQLSPNGSASIQLSPGSYTLALANVPANCTVAQPHSVTVTVVVNQTVNASFAVTCLVVQGGSIRITASTTGAISASPYTANVVPCDGVHPCSGSVPAGGTGTIVQVPGAYTVSLADVPENCTVAEPRSVAVSVTASQTVDVSFQVTCPPAGTLRVKATVTGPNPDEHFLAVEGDCDYYYVCNYKELDVGGSVEFSLVAGTYAITLANVEPNCSVALPNPRSVTVVANVEIEITFAVTCVAITRIHVSVPTTGPDQDQNYLVGVSDCSASLPCAQMYVQAGGTIEVLVPPGTHTVQLTDVASNCTVSGANPVVVTTTTSSVTDVTFQVTCTALPTVRVTAPTSGTNRDASYSVVNESTCDYYYGCWQQSLPATGIVQFKVTPGSYVFRLIDIASNCTVTGPNPVTVHPVTGVTDLVFPVTCQ